MSAIRSVACYLAQVLSLAAVAAAAEPAAKAADNWHYVAESDEAGFDRPPLRKLALSDERPENVSETVAYRGNKRLYGELRYGSPNSNRVIVVIDEREGNEFDLYVDGNRNRTIEPKDRVEGTGPLRSTMLPTEILQDEAASHLPRRVVLRRSALDGGLSFATTGYLAGTVSFAGKTIAARRVDGDGNGFFADPRDRLWLDLDGDGKWDAFSEQFPLVPILKLDDKRYAVRSDAIGSRLALDEITGLGTLRLELATLAAGVHVADLELMLMGEDGSAWSLRGGDAAVQVPVGRYAVKSLSLSLARKEDREPWSFVFSRLSSPEAGQWHEVTRDGEVAIDPIGTPRFVFEFPDGAESVRPGKTCSVEPRLYTHEGLLINSCAIGGQGRTQSYNSGPRAEIQLLSGDRKLLSTEHSGFA